MFSQKDVRVFLKAYNDRGDSLKQGITHILMKEKDVCNELIEGNHPHNKYKKYICDLENYINRNKWIKQKN